MTPRGYFSSEMSRPVGFYKEGGKTKPITARKQSKTRTRIIKNYATSSTSDLWFKWEKAVRFVTRVSEAAEDIKKDLPPEEDFDPFDDYQTVIARAAKEFREKLISKAIRVYHKKYLPNAEIPSSTTFVELMDEAVGEDQFRASVIEGWFKEQMAKGAETSLETMKASARGLRPYHVKELDQLVKGRYLTLRAHTWSSSFEHASIDSRTNEGLYALEKLIEIVLNDADPVYVEWTGVFTNHTRQNWYRRDGFYTKQSPHSYSTDVKSFRFYKNGNLKIEFKTQDDAEKVARLLLP